ncbi:hypothetical protein BK120_30060 [Paenibacillus sp. FSL A5-0031]|nr:hypothetical protein BK120_30060 [Paenibacillus sp. FSL A5-0031]
MIVVKDKRYNLTVSIAIEIMFNCPSSISSMSFMQDLYFKEQFDVKIIDHESNVDNCIKFHCKDLIFKVKHSYFIC